MSIICICESTKFKEDQVQVSHAVGVLFYSPYFYEWMPLFDCYGDLESETIDWIS